MKNKKRTRQTFLNGDLNPYACLYADSAGVLPSMLDAALFHRGVLGCGRAREFRGPHAVNPVLVPSLALPAPFLSVYPFGADGFIASARFGTQGHNRAIHLDDRHLYIAGSMKR